MPRLYRNTREAIVAPTRLSASVGERSAPYRADVARYVNASCSSATRRAYTADVAHFVNAGFTIPCREDQIAAYLAMHAQSLAVSTLRRRLVAIHHAHNAVNSPSPVNATIVKTIMRGIRRTRGASQRRVKAMDKRVLLKVLRAMDRNQHPNKLKRLRDRAVLLVGFAGGFRRDELVKLNVDDIGRTRTGIEFHVRRSKTDQEAVGRKVFVPKSQGAHCPVKALWRWLRYAHITEGAIFRSVNRHGQISTDALTAQSVAAIVKSSVAEAGLDPRQFAAHSLRAGFVTAATVANVPIWQIKRVTGHRSDEVVATYVRVARRVRGVSLL